jgi:hypothetical protein
MAEAWTRGEATIDQARAAADAAYAAYAAADAAYAAYAAADAARAAYAAARAAADAAFAADHAAYAVYAALKDVANIVRKIIPWNVIKKAIAEYEGKEGK